MISANERSDIIRIMKMNRFSLSDSDTAHLEFAGQVKGKDYRVNRPSPGRYASGFY
jgi:hypothetical protein